MSSCDELGTHNTEKQYRTSFQHEKKTRSIEVQSYLNFSLLIVNIIIQIKFKIEILRLIFIYSHVIFILVLFYNEYILQKFSFKSAINIWDIH